MKNSLSPKILLLLLFTVVLCISCNQNKTEEDSFSFAFFTDIHLNNGDNGCFDGLQKAIVTAEESGAGFIITGGDNADIDVLKTDTLAARDLFGRYKSIIENSPLEFRPTMGNHDRFWGIVSEEKPHGETLFEEYIGPAYYSFDYKNWHFIILSTVQVVNDNYGVDSLQMEWIKNDLSNVDINTPVVVSCHVPMISVYTPAVKGMPGVDMFSNMGEVRDLFNNHNLKLVLQGHQHVYEEIKTRDIQYITAGAVSGSWWGGQYYETEEGFLLVSISGDEFSWRYVDYGWDVAE